MTDKDRRDIKEIVTEVVTGLRELIEEKLNGHGATVERHGAQINQLYDLDRARVSDVSLLNKEVVRLDGRIDALSQVTKLEEEARDKRETAVETVTDKATAKVQFSATTWISIGFGILSLVVAVWALLQ